MAHSRLFGTDGIRGVANVAPMDSETVMRVGRAVAHVMRRSDNRHRILIGKDTRVSGYMLESALATGISSMGVDVLLVGPLPTPGVAYMTRSMRADAGVMISASHNPYEDNGIKFFGADGFKLADETEKEIERLLEPGHLDELRASPELVGKAFRIDDAIGRYIVYLKSCFDRDISLEGLTVVLDTAHGAAYKVAPMLFAELGATVIMHGDRPNGKNINDHCGSLHPEAMAKLVREHRAFCGIAFDGDADRVIFCDERGDVLDGDTLLAMLTVDYQERGLLKGNGLVATTMSNFGLELMLRERGVDLIRAGVGDRYVLQEMLARGMNLGGEQSGHIISLDHNTTGDGILSSLLVLSAAVRKGQPLSTFHGLFQRYPQKLVNVPVKAKPTLTELPELMKLLASAERELEKRGRVVLRYSGTENKLRVMVECDDAGLVDRIVTELARVGQEEIARTV